MSEFLFIGGTHDGERHDVPAGWTECNLPGYQNSLIRDLYDSEQVPDIARFENEIYFSATLSVGSQVFRVFKLYDMTDAEMVRALIANYRKKEQPDD